jgi:hypothetical protein
MRDWHHDKWTDIGLRLGGAALGGLAWLAAHGLIGLHTAQTHAPPEARAVIFAAAAFLCASLSAVLITQGHHIFDKVEISERWRSVPPPDTDIL